MQYRVVLIALLALSAAASADSAPDTNASDLSGTWRTVTAESEPMEPVMEAQGIPWLQRKAAGMVSLEFVFRQNGTDLEQAVQSSLVSKQRKYRMNAPEYEDEDFRGHSMRAREWWTGVGAFSRRMKYESGAVVTVHRNLREDGRHIDVLFEIERPGHEKQTVKRLLQRVDEESGH